VRGGSGRRTVGLSAPEEALMASRDKPKHEAKKPKKNKGKKNEQPVVITPPMGGIPHS
jgi:hypothetical protein